MESQTNDLTSLPLQLFVKNLDGETLSLQFPAPSVSAASIKQRIQDITKVPIHFQRLICGHQLKDNSSISQPNATLNLSLRLRGGKGGFGSLLRGAASKAGQKKTSNFEACRDMSGRRLRHVNAEKKLEEWKAEEEGRKLEKIAEQFIKKKAKTGKKGVGDGEAQKYVEKYREESARCVAVVEESVRAAVRNGKRKALPGGVDAKKLKIWMGKRKVGKSDGEDMDDDSSEDEISEESEKSIVLNNGDLSDSSEGTEGIGSVADAQADGDLPGAGSSDSGSEEDKEAVGHQSLKSVGEDVPNVDNSMVMIKPEIHRENMAESTSLSSSGSESPSMEPEKHEPNEIQTENVEAVAKPVDVSVSDVVVDGELFGHVEDSLASKSAKEVGGSNVAEPDKPLNFDKFNSAKEMEVLGMEKLKDELQTRGLKCGGTLQERAARLFLLKSTPLEKLPKKLLAKK